LPEFFPDTRIEVDSYADFLVTFLVGFLEIIPPCTSYRGWHFAGDLLNSHLAFYNHHSCFTNKEIRLKKVNDLSKDT
jgi:hypothetical protein